MKSILLFVLMTLPFILNAGQAPDKFLSGVRLEVDKYKLKNGMTVLLYEDHSAPLVSVQQWYRVGSRNEVPGHTGLAHFFEHLMFKGTKKYSGDNLIKTIKSNGGSFNAMTSRDYTGYYVNLPSDKLEVVLDIESDRMVNLLFDQKKIDAEREVVKEERRLRVENSVGGALWESLFKTVFKVHNYRWPVLGYMTDLNAATIADFKNFYKTYYAPNNSVLVIAGDFSASKAKSLVEKYYAEIPASNLPEVKVAREPEQQGHRTSIIRKEVQAPTFMVAFQAPSASDSDLAAMELLGQILGGGDSSRIHQKLVYRQQLASSVWASSYSPKEEGVFIINVSMKPGHDINKAIEGVYSEVFKARTALVSEEELEAARNQIVTDLIGQMKTISGKAHTLALTEVVYGDYRRMFSDLKRYYGVTVEDVKKAAAKYLTPNRRSVIKAIPKAVVSTAQTGGH